MKRLFSFFILLSLLFAAALFGKSQIIYDKLASFGGAYNGVATDGNYSFVASKNGLKILDVSDKASVKLVNSLDTESELKKVALKDDYVFIASDENTLKIVKKSDPLNLDDSVVIKTSAPITDFTVYQGYLYITISENGLEIFKMPTVEMISLSSVTDTNGTASAVAVEGDYAYVIDKFKGMQIINVANKLNPSLAGFYPYTSPVSNLAVSGDYVYFADGYNGIEVVYVKDKNKPVHFTKIDTQSYVYDVKISGDYLYAACGTGGVKIYNISEPESAYKVGEYDTKGSARGLFLKDDYLFVADYDGGLDILDINNQGSVYNPYLAGAYSTLAGVYSVMREGEYLYVSDKSVGVAIFDLSDENNITLAGTYKTKEKPQDVFSDGNYLYIAEGKGGLEIVDATDKSDPVLKGAIDINDADALRVKVKDGMAYIAGGDGGLVVVDVSVPTYPTLKGIYNTEGTVRDVFVKDNYAYIADGMAGVKIIDISDDTYPLVGSVDTDGYAMGIKVVGRYAYVADGGSGLEIIDVSDPANPVLIGNNDTDATSYKKLSVSGNNVFVADSDDGVDVLDVSNPMHPQYLGTYLSKSMLYDVDSKDSIVYVANGSRGVQIVKVTVMPTPPSNLKLVVKDSRTIELTWSDNSNNETGFKIFRNGVLIATVGANVTKYTDTGLIPGATYTYEVRATNNIGDSLPATATATTEGEPPSAPTNLMAVSVGSKSIKLTWSDNSNNETGFKIFRDNELVATVPANTTSYVDTGLVKGKTYYYEVRATNEKGDSDPVSTEAMPVDPKIELFVQRLYLKILNREVDPNGKKYWTEKLQKGATATSVAKSFFNSAEFVDLQLSDSEYITRAYETLLNREPDPEGLVYWLHQKDVAGLNRNQIFYGLALSKEFSDLCQQTYGILAYDAADLREAFVERFYNLVLGRDADLGGVKYWTNELKSKRKSAEDIANGFFFSEEFKNRAVSNEKFVEIAYRTLLNREADLEGKNFWVGKLNNGYSRSAMILDFVYTPEFESLAKKYDIKAHND